MGEERRRRGVRRRIVLAAIAAGCVLAAAGTAGIVLARGSGNSEGTSSQSELAGGTAALSERAYLDLMIPHHEMAVQMAKIAERRSHDLAVLEIARDVLSEQPYEIRLMEGWRKQWFGVPANERVTMSSADAGMMGMAADMGALAKQKGTTFATQFFADMIPHHAGAVVMSQRLLLGHPRPPLAHLARVIMASQSAQIGTMERYSQIASGGAGGSTLAPVSSATPATPATPLTPGA